MTSPHRFAESLLFSSEYKPSPVPETYAARSPYMMRKRKKKFEDPGQEPDGSPGDQSYSSDSSVGDGDGGPAGGPRFRGRRGRRPEPSPTR